MNTNVKTLKEWFDKLQRVDQEEVLKFVYGEEQLVKKGEYYGPRMITEKYASTRGMFCGPAPSTGPAVCGSCGRPY